MNPENDRKNQVGTPQSASAFARMERLPPLLMVLYLVMLAITVMFVILVAAYVSARLRSGVPTGMLALPRYFSLSTIVLVLSSYTIGQAPRLYAQDDLASLGRCLGATLLLGCVFAGLQVLGLPIDSALSKYWLCLSILVVVSLLAKNLVRGAVGREWMAIRDMDVAAAVIGIRPMYAKLSAFAVSSFIIGVAGALWAFVYLGAWEPAAFSVDISFRLLFMVIIGGLGSILGGFLGAAFITILPIALSQALPAVAGLFGMQVSTAAVSHAELMIFGGLIVWFLIVEPHGLARLWAVAKQKLRLWPFPH